MVAFDFQSVIAGVPSAYLTGITDLDIETFSGSSVLYASSGVPGGVVAYQLTGSGVTLLDTSLFAAGQIQATPSRLENVSINGVDVLIALGHHSSDLECFTLSPNGAIASAGNLDVEGNLPAAVTALATAIVDGVRYYYTGQWGTDGLTIYKETSSGALREIGRLGLDSSEIQGADVTAIAPVTLGGETYLLGLSQIQNSVTCYRIGDTGMPETIGAVSAAEGLAISAPTDLIPVIVDGVQYVLVAAAGSGSLSLLRLESDGALTPTDHVIDELDTRFQAVGAVAVETVDDQLYVVVGGGDDGLSLMTILPGGRFLHLATIADDAAMGLSNITALALAAEGDVLNVFASGESDSGITHLSVDLNDMGQVLTGGSGADTLIGGAGDDVLMDGAGQDALYGQGGADVFVLTGDGQRDDIHGFELGVDRLDLSGIGRLYSLDQVDIITTSWGAQLTFEGEEIRLYSHDFNPIVASQIQIGDLRDLSHYVVEYLTPTGPIMGSEGTDHLNGNGADDLLDGIGGDDVLTGFAGDDTLIGGLGNDLVSGGEGGDSLLGNTGDDTLEGGDGVDTLKAGDGDDTLYGGNGNDRLYGGSDADCLYGGAGGDRLYGNVGEDTLFGDDGEDRLYGDAGKDRLYGGSGRDLLEGADGWDQLYGQAGDDTLYGGTGRDTIDGGNDDDLVWGGAEGDKLYGGKGDDTLRGDSGDDTLFGDKGYDTLRGGAGADEIFGGERADRLLGEDGNDRLSGEDGGDRIYGGAGADTLSGGNGDDTLIGEGGSDTLNGGTGKDRIFGGGGDDSLRGGDNGDQLYGDAGDDTLRGDAGHDRLTGGRGDDELRGGTGKDRLAGGEGNDTLYGGTGRDTFVFSDGFGADVIADFGFQGGADVIDLALVSGITNYNDLINNHISEVGSDLQITVAGQTITLQNTALSDLESADFLF